MKELPTKEDKGKVDKLAEKSPLNKTGRLKTWRGVSFAKKSWTAMDKRQEEPY